MPIEQCFTQPSTEKLLLAVDGETNPKAHPHWTTGGE